MDQMHDNSMRPFDMERVPMPFVYENTQFCRCDGNSGEHTQVIWSFYLANKMIMSQGMN